LLARRWLLVSQCLERNAQSAHFIGSAKRAKELASALKDTGQAAFNAQR
jgi:hypothetical protein